jgi:uncharacterized protein (TIGR03067 family)
MLRTTLAAPAVILVLIILSPLFADAKKESDALQGKWSVVSLTRDGKVEAISKDAVRVIADDAYTMKLHPLVTIKGTYKIDPTANPKAIETTASSGPYKDMTMLGIYELDGDSLKICYAIPGKDRPTEFTSKVGSCWILVVHKRLKE